jgi:hypothetical protein
MNPLATEESFEKFVNGICCNGCKFFINEKCTEKDYEKHNLDKTWTVQAALDEYLHSTNELTRKNEKKFIENINNYYVCEQFESNIKPITII